MAALRRQPADRSAISSAPRTAAARAPARPRPPRRPRRRRREAPRSPRRRTSPGRSAPSRPRSEIRTRSPQAEPPALPVWAPSGAGPRRVSSRAYSLEELRVAHGQGSAARRSDGASRGVVAESSLAVVEGVAHGLVDALLAAVAVGDAGEGHRRPRPASLPLGWMQDDDRGHAVEVDALGDPRVLGDVLGVGHEDARCRRGSRGFRRRARAACPRCPSGCMTSRTTTSPAS